MYLETIYTQDSWKQLSNLSFILRFISFIYDFKPYYGF